jgi:hypothetical protein
LYLSCANVYHKISQLDDNCIDVNRLTDSRRRRSALSKAEPVHLHFAVRRPELDRYVPHSFAVDVPNPVNYAWNLHDIVVSDRSQHCDNISELCAAGITLIIVPISSTSEEEVRVSAFKKFMGSIERQSKKPFSIETLSVFERASAAGTRSAPGQVAPRIDPKNTEAVVEGILNPAVGPIICDRRLRFHTYGSCLVAEELVDWAEKHIAGMSQSGTCAAVLCWPPGGRGY